jgi:hypothetical protein
MGNVDKILILGLNTVISWAIKPNIRVHLKIYLYSRTYGLVEWSSNCFTFVEMTVLVNIINILPVVKFEDFNLHLYCVEASSYFCTAKICFFPQVQHTRYFIIPPIWPLPATPASHGFSWYEGNSFRYLINMLFYCGFLCFLGWGRDMLREIDCELSRSNCPYKNTGI